jgi:glycosyltransferase involved in cell wall biosynthesis
VRILLWHGYLLSGSGSNIYTANVARAWRDQGHDVLVICQDHWAGLLTFVDEEGDFDKENKRWGTEPTGVRPSSGRVSVVRPDIGGLLPVYVHDEYEGFEVKRFIELTDDELEAYTQSNVQALISAIEVFDPEAIITGHEVMGPYIAKGACKTLDRTFVAKLHGSALEYAVKVQDRYQAFAGEGLRAAKHVIGGSHYMVSEASRVVPGWESNAVVINPGCDVDLFKPIFVRNDLPRVGYVGKLIAAKGVQDLLAALPLVRQGPLDLTVVGFGGFQSELEAMAAAFQRGHVGGARDAVKDEPLAASAARLLETVAEDGNYSEAAKKLTIRFTGPLDHVPLAQLLPQLDLLVVPSIVPEAFGMVAAEAAACGVVPLVPRHSGIGEVGAAIESELSAPGLVTFDPNDTPRSIADAIDRMLDLPTETRREIGVAVRRLAEREWSWERVAERLLAVASS